MIHCSELTKTFRRNGSEVVSLDRVSLEIGPVNSWSCAGQAVPAKPRCSCRSAACNNQAPAR